MDNEFENSDDFDYENNVLDETEDSIPAEETVEEPELVNDEPEVFIDNSYHTNEGFKQDIHDDVPLKPYSFSNQYNKYTDYNNQNGNSSKGKKAVIIIIAISLILAVACAAVSRIGKSKEKPTSTSDSSTLFSISTTNPADESTSVSDTQNNVTESTQGMIITSAPTQVTVPQTTELSAVEIADQCRPVSVGVLVYKDGQLNGEGSGVVMGFDSTRKYTYIMTCAHVISDPGVTFSILKLDGTSKQAGMVGYDTKTDIGVLKVEGTDYIIADFGDSSTLKIGESVYAIGNPGGSDYFGSMTRGIVSAIDRSVSGTRNLTCIQHDAAINPGNSGGALINSKGQVIGINSSKISDTDYEGMGFAVPINLAKSISENLINYGYVPNRPKLGITYADVNNYQIYSMVVAIKGLPTGSLIITSITDDSAFVGTKAEVGDMIIAVNGNKMNSSNVLLDIIDKGAVGETMTLTLCRVNSRTYQTSTFDVTIKLVEDRGSQTTTTTTEQSTNIYDSNYGNNQQYGDFSDFFRDYFGF